MRLRPVFIVIAILVLGVSLTGSQKRLRAKQSPKSPTAQKKLDAASPKPDDKKTEIRIPLTEFTRIAMPDFQPRGDNPAVREMVKTVNEVLWNDLKYSSFFEMPSKSFYPLRSIADPGTINYDEWRALQPRPDFVIVGNVQIIGSEVVLEGWVLDAQKGAEAFGKRIRGGSDQVRDVAHRFSDILVYQLTAGASRGIAATKLAYASSPRRGGNREIHLMDYDGGNPRPFSKTSADNTFPDWAPDNNRIAFGSRRAIGFQDIVIISTVDGTKQPFPTFNSFAGSPGFSPDGKRIAFARRTPETNAIDIYVADVNGKNMTNLTNSRSINTSPCWSPYGRQMAFVSDRTGVRHIYIMDSDGSNLRKVLNEGGNADSPDWSPDGQRIAFTWRPQKGMFQDIYVMEVATGKIFQLTVNAGNNESPSWAPDGKHLVFQSDRVGDSHIYSMLSDGTEQRRLTWSGVNTSPAWSKYYDIGLPASPGYPAALIR
ncbi:MAG: PD40 domain-containing protein [Acidobacteria bacterium]|nr:PD40 domain-containing protein [Acidobacteriota bacterium]MBI3657091.1 PD40 domain-containing protein [Acidobacteriota bacterium]